MGFLDKAKEKASQLADQAKEKVDDLKDKRKADELLDGLGRALYRQRTGRGTPADEAVIAGHVAQLQALEAAGTDVLSAEPASSEPASSPPGGAPLPPPIVSGHDGPAPDAPTGPPPEPGSFPTPS